MITTAESLELEAWLEGTLSFSQHISKLQVTVKSRLGFLYRNRSSFTPAAKLTLIHMTFQPMLDYGDGIYRLAAKGATRCSLPLPS